MAVNPRKLTHIVVVLLIFLTGDVNGVTDGNDLKILNDFRSGLENPGLLKWPKGGNDPCGPPSWPHLACFGGRVTEIQVQGLGLQGRLPPNLNRLGNVQQLGFQKNYLTGTLPSLSGLSNLQYANFSFNNFDTIPSDFFRGLHNITVIALDNNPFKQWSIPNDLAELSQLVNFSCSNCNIVGGVPDFFGNFSSLNSLKLSSNRLSGEIPSSFGNSLMQNLWLNDQEGGGMSGSIGVIGSMVLLTTVWLQGNQFTGPIPDNIGSLISLIELKLSRNRLIGLIPEGLATLNLELLDLDHNLFMGMIPNFNAYKVMYGSNSFCHPVPGVQCDPQVCALLGFLHGVNYPERLSLEWTGNDPCRRPWWGILCNSRNEVSVINLANLGLNGTLSPSLVNLPSLVEIHIQGNNLHGVVPADLTLLHSLRLLDLSGNNFTLPLPKFSNRVTVVMVGNKHPLSPFPAPSPNPRNLSISRTAIILASVVGSVVFSLVAVLLAFFCLKKMNSSKVANGVVHHPRDSLGPGNIVKTASEAKNGSVNAQLTVSGSIEFPLQDLRDATNNFSQEHAIGHGGFGVVYKGILEDGVKLAVKRMEAGIINDKAMTEFGTEISVLSTVRHRNLVALLGYSVEGNERLLVYEYMPQGALSQHLFRWKSLNLQPLSWKKRLNIALDVARGVEYLHTFAHQSFIHRDLKPANILLDDDFRAKVSDFGLVKLVLDSESSVVTRLAGTFGYLAPEYAVTGKITTKVDVFSFGVILMELLTGLVAVDERRPEEKQYLVEWFWQIKSNTQTLIASIDPSLEAKEDIYDSMLITAELAGHCTVRDPNYRPDMGYVVSVLTQLVETWKPKEESGHCSLDNNSPLSLPELVKGWKDEECSSGSEGYTPAKPPVLADSFGSGDGR